MIKSDLMRYIPKYYKGKVENISKGATEWNDYTHRWNTTIIVEWSDTGETDEYQNATYMFNKLKEFGREKE